MTEEQVEKAVQGLVEAGFDMPRSAESGPWATRELAGRAPVTVPAGYQPPFQAPQY